MAAPAINLAIENYIPVVRQAGGLYTALPMYVAGDLTVTGTTNIASVSLTDLSTTGNTTLGNAATDTLAITGLATQTLASSVVGNVEPFAIATTLSGVGATGGRFKSSLTTNVALGAWSNALKGEVTYGASGSTSGLGSAIVAEMTLSAGTSVGTYAPLEIELNLGTGAVTGTATSLIYASVNGADKATFDDNGFILNLAGLTAGAGDAFQTGLTAGTVNAACTAALKIKVGATTYYIPLATATT